MPFFIFFSVLIIQRLLELAIARRNEKWMKERGAIEFGIKHYQFIVLMHSMFFVVFLFEKVAFSRELSSFWPFLAAVFVCVQLIRLWAISSLGRYWNTKIIVLPNVEVVRKGPYRFIKHPNYLVVSIEFMVIPMMFGAYITAGLFTLLNILMLLIRIPAEEKALQELTEYEGSFESCNRFLPKLLNKYDN
ncbi:isoprenylcysteine carboxylmethyltransferase family protein [Neobacillus sp. YX16]|uniref:isoprenylcysteine carboxyl methyltransferase family protein n=1 Tax=Neobacillus sp. YX16 TaxID=3047874 RepID=UPI0024C32F35|nr:isoprenylcysteine carboxylmethyltransferase family protein [Neobacillus sp. YX16]WHZ06110.1 isoprenylcysteine carboxylmethyltransferase family protein [Neobacillus sp. YX16]